MLRLTILRAHLSDVPFSLLRAHAAPNFVSSFTQGDFVYFFFRETAVEYINCGKVSFGGWVVWRTFLRAHDVCLLLLFIIYC